MVKEGDIVRVDRDGQFCKVVAVRPIDRVVLLTLPDSAPSWVIDQDRLTRSADGSIETYRRPTILDRLLKRPSVAPPAFQARFWYCEHGFIPLGSQAKERPSIQFEVMNTRIKSTLSKRMGDEDVIEVSGNLSVDDVLTNFVLPATLNWDGRKVRVEIAFDLDLES